MALFELLGNWVAGVLLMYLAFTNAAADNILTLIEKPGTEQPASENASETIPSSDAITVSVGLQNLSVRLANAVRHSASRVLLDDGAFQQAALGAAGIQENLAQDPATPVPDRIEDALVNIFCQYKTDQYVRTTTGTGFFIHPKGIILTNAHVAQFLLLKDSDSKVIDASCVVRSGNPALPKYRAELLYISPMWIYENASLITEETPRGTGERDYALLYVSKSADEEVALPETYPFITVDTSLLTIYTKGIEVLTAGYPAEVLQREGARAKLVPVLASTTVVDLYTFGSNYADVFTVSESPVGEQGASGGPVARSDGSAIGLVVTKGDPGADGAHSLRAITLSYIDRTIKEETGFTLGENLRGDIAYRSRVFKEALVPFLANLLATKISQSD